MTKVQDIQDQKTKQEINVNKQFQKLDIPDKWKQVSQEFSESHKKVWDIKYYEKLVLLTESITKKYFYQHIFKEYIEEEYQKRFIRYVLPPDLKDQSIIKKRKIYSKDVVCALFDQQFYHTYIYNQIMDYYVGKSSSINQLCDRKFDPEIKSTTCYKINQAQYIIDDQLYTLSFWDCVSYHNQSY